MNPNKLDLTAFAEALRFTSQAHNTAYFYAFRKKRTPIVSGDLIVFPLDEMRREWSAKEYFRNPTGTKPWEWTEAKRAYYYF